MYSYGFMYKLARVYCSGTRDIYHYSKPLCQSNMAMEQLQMIFRFKPQSVKSYRWNGHSDHGSIKWWFNLENLGFMILTCKNHSIIGTLVEFTLENPLNQPFSTVNHPFSTVNHAFSKVNSSISLAVPVAGPRPGLLRCQDQGLGRGRLCSTFNIGVFIGRYMHIHTHTYIYIYIFTYTYT